MKSFRNRTLLHLVILASRPLFPAYPNPIKIDNIIYVTEGQTTADRSFQNFHHAVLKAKRSVEKTFAQDFRMPITIVITRDAPQFTKLTGLN